MVWRKARVCTRCGSSDGPFLKAKRGRFGISGRCVPCMIKLQREYRATPSGRAIMMWNAIQQRCGVHKYYKHVEILVTREEFMAWAIPTLERWMKKHPGVSPSIDRIESDGHYEFGNMRIVTRGENTAARKYNKNRFAPKGTAWCGKCSNYLPCVIFLPVRVDRPCKGIVGNASLLTWPSGVVNSEELHKPE